MELYDHLKFTINKYLKNDHIIIFSSISLLNVNFRRGNYFILIKYLYFDKLIKIKNCYIRAIYIDMNIFKDIELPDIIQQITKYIIH